MGAIYKNFSSSQNSTEAERLYNMTFKGSIEMIKRMDTIKKAQITGEIQPILEELYAQADTYGNDDIEPSERINTELFMVIMGKIKKWETLLYWLFEMDILMCETSLDKLIAEAEERLREHDDKDFKRIRIKECEDGKKHRVEVSAYEDLSTLYAEKQANQSHMNEIVNMANELTNKYFKMNKGMY